MTTPVIQAVNTVINKTPSKINSFQYASLAYSIPPAGTVVRNLPPPRSLTIFQVEFSTLPDAQTFMQKLMPILPSGTQLNSYQLVSGNRAVSFVL